MLKSFPPQLDNPSSGEDVKPLNDGSRQFFHFSGKTAQKKHPFYWALPKFDFDTFLKMKKVGQIVCRGRGTRLPKLIWTLFIFGAKTKVK